MQPFALGILLITLLCADVFAQENSHLASPESQVTLLPSHTFYSTPINGPECTGCFLEAITPTPLSYPGTVYCLDLTVIETVPSFIRYTIVKSDGCTTTTLEPFTPTDGPISTTSITWETSGISLTWPTTYNAYSVFEAGTWSHGGASDCTISPTTVYAQSPIIYPASSFPATLAPVPSQVVQSIINDPSIQLPFDISTCTANGALPIPLHADLEPACSCTAGSPPPQSCIPLPASTTTRNTLVHSGYRRNQGATPPALLHVARQSAAADADDAATATETHTSRRTLGISNGGMLIQTSSGSEATNRSGTTSTPSTARTTSTDRGTSSSTSPTSLSFNSSISSTSLAAISSGSSFVA